MPRRRGPAAVGSEYAGVPRADLNPGRVAPDHPQTRGVAFESRDGYTWIIDPTTLAPARFDGAMRSIPRPDPPSGTPVMGGYPYSFNDETRCDPTEVGQLVPRLTNPLRAPAWDRGGLSNPGRVAAGGGVRQRRGGSAERRQVDHRKGAAEPSKG